MLRSLYIAATGMDAQQTQLDVISNNIANASTTGFKGARAEFEDLLADQLHAPAAPETNGSAPPAPLEVGLGGRTAATTRSQAQGSLLNTGNATDLAIQGTGLFRVTRANGEYGYTRAGNFRVDAQGRLTTQAGELVDPEITVPQEASQLTVGADGTVTVMMPGKTTTQQLGVLELSIFPNPGGLESLGNNLFGASPSSGEPTQLKPGDRGTGSLSQGFLESSNVSSVGEMVNMISTQHAWELNSKVIQTADQMLAKLTTLR
jgi:flagellar basal-body rod protein FlgG